MSTWTIKIIDVQYKKQEITIVVDYSFGAKVISKTFTFDVREDLTQESILHKLRRFADSLEAKQSLFQELKALEGTVIPNE